MNVWEWETIDDIDLKWLKANCNRLYYFGLGFIQLKIDETYRIHFYSEDLPTLTEDIHDHRYGFESKILKGCLVNSRWKIVDGVGFNVHYESCSPTKEAPSLEQVCGIKMASLEILTPGKSYQMGPDEFHRVTGMSCITLLKRGPVIKEFAKIITPVGQAPVCPFSKKYPDDELWSMMERMVY